MPEERKAKGGVAILLYKDLARRVQRIDRFKDRIIAVTLKNDPVNLVIIQVYMPTGDHDDEEIEEMYEKL